jgi:hypothetical protein
MLVIPGTGETSTLLVNGGKISIVRRLRSSETSPGVTSLDKPAQARFFIGDHESRSPAMIAAEAAAKTHSLEFVPDSERRARLNRQVRVSRLLMGVAVACVLASAGAYRRGLSHQLDAITSQRGALRARVTQAMAARDTLASLAGSINAIGALHRSAPRWSAVFSRIAIALPRDASLIGLRADGDSVTLEGQASNASAVFGALRSAPSVVGVRSTAPIRQELTVDKGSVERWTLALRVAHDVAVLSGR